MYYKDRIIISQEGHKRHPSVLTGHKMAVSYLMPHYWKRQNVILECISQSISSRDSEMLKAIQGAGETSSVLERWKKWSSKG